MTTFDLTEVQKFADRLETRMVECENGEGMECATIDSALTHYAKICDEFRDGARAWGQAIFTGKVAFDPDVEKLFVDRGKKLLLNAYEMLEASRQAEIPCFVLSGINRLQAAIWSLMELVEKWQSPCLAVSPSARQWVELTEGIRENLNRLTPLPADWQPSDSKQRQQFKRLRNQLASKAR